MFNLTLLFIPILLVIGLYYKSLPPVNLRHIPRVSFWKCLWAMIFSIGFEERYEIYKQLLEKEGICLAWSFGRWIVYIAREEDIHTVLNDSNNFEKLLLSDLVGKTTAGNFFGNNIVYSNGKDWRKHRRAVNQFFHKSWDYKALVNQCFKLCERLEEEIKKDNGVISPHVWNEKLTLDMLGKSVFDIDFKELEEQHSKAAELYIQSMIIVNKPLYVMLPFMDNFRKKDLAIVQEFDDLIESYITERKKLLDEQKIDPDNDALTALVDASSDSVPDEYKLNYKEMMWTFKMLFLAGHDTTSMALSGLLYHLAIYPEIQNKARQEIQAQIHDIQDIKESELKSLKYIDLIIKENLRLVPPLAINIDRINSKPTQFQDYFIPEKTLIQPHFYHSMRSEHQWKNPLEFQPERFLENKAKSWLPFSIGGRACLGSTLSLLEQKIFLAVILSQFKIEYPNNKVEQLKFGMIDLLYPVDLKLKLVKLN